MSILNIVPLGYGGGVPLTDNGNTNFMLFMSPEAVLGHETRHFSEYMEQYPYWLIDCGPDTIHKICTSFPAPSPAVKNLQGVLLTHCHADHSGGLATLAWRSKFVEQVKPKLITPPECEELLRKQLCELTFGGPGFDRDPMLEDFFDATWSRGREFIDFDIGSMTVDFFEVDHHIPRFPNFGIRLTSPMNGKQVVFSGDAAEPISIDLEKVELLFHDCQFYSPASQPLSQAVHCPFWALNEATPEEHRSKVVLAHTNVVPSEDIFELGYLWAGQEKLFALEVGDSSVVTIVASSKSDDEYPPFVGERLAKELAQRAPLVLSNVYLDMRSLHPSIVTSSFVTRFMNTLYNESRELAMEAERFNWVTCLDIQQTLLEKQVHDMQVSLGLKQGDESESPG